MNVSICIATYGSEDWAEMALSRAKPSADSQSVKDGDSWRTPQVAVGHFPKESIASARNTLALNVTGDWLCFLDADDELGPGYLVAMKRAFERGRRDDGHSLLLTPAVSYVVKGRVRSPRFLPGNDLRKNNYLVVGTLVQRDLFIEVGGFSDYSHGFEDFSLWSKCYRAGARVVQVRRAVYIAYVNEGSIHRTNWKDRQWQVAMHERVARELDEWEAARA